VADPLLRCGNLLFWLIRARDLAIVPIRRQVTAPAGLVL
jgi:hypothetical protein